MECGRPSTAFPWARRQQQLTCHLSTYTEEAHASPLHTAEKWESGSMATALHKAPGPNPPFRSLDSQPVSWRLACEVTLTLAWNQRAPKRQRAGAVQTLRAPLPASLLPLSSQFLPGGATLRGAVFYGVR